ncbi:unnamed protein product, partial [Staurois parvus]
GQFTVLQGGRTLVSVGGIVPVVGVIGRNGALLVSVGGIVPHCWYQSQEWCPVVGVSGRNSTSLLVSMAGMVPHCWC